MGEKMTWAELRGYIRKYNQENDNHYNSMKKHLTAAIVFSNDSPWDRHDYSVEERTYEISNDDKYWHAECGGSSLYGVCKAESGLVRLDWYIHHWVVEYCYIISQE